MTRRSHDPIARRADARLARRILAAVFLAVGAVLAGWGFAATPSPAAPDSTSALGGRYIDSLKTLPDSVLIPPGSMPDRDREQTLEFMRRMFRAPESTYVGPDVTHRSDLEMTKAFNAHRREFDQLVAMFTADSTVDRIMDPNWGWNPSWLPHPVAEARWNEYQRLFAVTGVRMLARDEAGDFDRSAASKASKVILLRTTTIHTFDRKGYVYSTKPLTPLINHETTLETSAFVVYRLLAPRWYIYFQPMS